MKDLLGAVGVSRAFDGKPALTDVSVSVKRGEWLAILGASGSGKSTLLRILGRFIDQDSGEVRLNGDKLNPVHHQLIPGHEEMRLVHQEFALFPNQTVRENIAYPLRFQSKEKRDLRVEELLELTQLRSVQNQRAKVLSGGEKQRTAIAMSIAIVPEVLLLDEPFAHLDQISRTSLARVLRQLKLKEKLTCVFVTHDTADAMAWAETVTVLRNGSVVQAASPETLYTQPRNAYVAELTGVVNWLDKEKSAFVRAEKLFVTRSAARVKLEGKVVNFYFTGREWVYEVKVRSGEVFTLYRSSDSIPKGESVLLTYSERDVIKPA